MRREGRDGRVDRGRVVARRLAVPTNMTAIAADDLRTSPQIDRAKTQNSLHAIGAQIDFVPPG